MHTLHDIIVMHFILKVLSLFVEWIQVYARQVLQEVTAAVEKLNVSLAMKEKSQGSYFFGQDEIASLGLGPKGRSYVLMLLRMNKLVIENVDGSVSYKVL